MEFSENEDKILSRATGCVTLNKNILQTCWLISREGYLLTAGHGLTKSGNKVGDIVKVRFDDSTNSYESMVIEYVANFHNGVDYCILKLTEKPSLERDVIYLSDKVSTVNNLDFRIRGYRADNDTIVSRLIQTVVTGKIKSVTPEHSTNQFSRLLQLSTDSQTALHRMSGAAVCTTINGRVVAVGLQSKQDQEHKADLFAIPIYNLKKYSEIIKTLLNSTNPPILDLDQRLFCERKDQPRVLCRRILFVVSLAPDRGMLADDFRKSMYDKSETYRKDSKGRYITFQDHIHKRIKDLPWVKPSRIDIKFNWIQTNVTSREQEHFSDIFNTEKMINDRLDEYRVIFDLEGSLESYPASKNTTNAEFSHMISVKGTQGSSTSIDSNSFDLTISIPITPIERAVLAAFNILEDVILDIAVFRSAKAIAYSYPTIKAKHIFSAAKVDFMRRHEYHPYGLPTVPIGTKYISFGSCTRSSAYSPLDIQKLYRLWKDFIDFEYFPILHNQETGCLDDADFEDIVDALNKTRRFCGQMPIRQLEAKFRTLKENCPGGFFFLAIAASKPSNLQVRSCLAKLLGYKRYRSNMIAFFPFENLTPLIAYREYIKLAVFRYA